MTAIDLGGRVAIVTGAGGGLGRAHAHALAAAGAAVVVNDLGVALDGGSGGDAGGGGPSARAEAVVAEIAAAGGRALADPGNVADPAAAGALVARALEAFGRLDIVVNNAGILRDRSAHKMTGAEVDAVLDVHLRGAFNVTLPAWRHMRATGHGRIVMTTSAAGLFGSFGQANYAAAKAGLLGMVRALAVEGAGRDLLANAIAPLATTRMTEAEFAAHPGMFDPAFVSELVVYLASEACTVNGEVFSVGGGQISRIFLGLTPGIFRAGGRFAAGEIAERIDEVMATDGFLVPRDMGAEWDHILALHGIAPDTSGGSHG